MTANGRNQARMTADYPRRALVRLASTVVLKAPFQGRTKARNRVVGESHATIIQ